MIDKIPWLLYKFMHHFRMKSFSLIPCNKKDVSNFWCYCYHFTDSSQQNLFIWSCSFSIGKRRSTSRSFLVNFYKFYREIGVISWFFHMKIPAFTILPFFLTVKWVKIWLYVDVIHWIRRWTKTDLHSKITITWCDTNEILIYYAYKLLNGK